MSKRRSRSGKSKRKSRRSRKGKRKSRRRSRNGKSKRKSRRSRKGKKKSRRSRKGKKKSRRSRKGKKKSRRSRKGKSKRKSRRSRKGKSKRKSRRSRKGKSKKKSRRSRKGKSKKKSRRSRKRSGKLLKLSRGNTNIIGFNQKGNECDVEIGSLTLHIRPMPPRGRAMFSSKKPGYLYIPLREWNTLKLKLQEDNHSYLIRKINSGAYPGVLEFLNKTIMWWTKKDIIKNKYNPNYTGKK